MTGKRFTANGGRRAVVIMFIAPGPMEEVQDNARVRKLVLAKSRGGMDHMACSVAEKVVAQSGILFRAPGRGRRRRRVRGFPSSVEDALLLAVALGELILQERERSGLQARLRR